MSPCSIHSPTNCCAVNCAPKHGLCSDTVAGAAVGDDAGDGEPTPDGDADGLVSTDDVDCGAEPVLAVQPTAAIAAAPITPTIVIHFSTCLVIVPAPAIRGRSSCVVPQVNR